MKFDIELTEEGYIDFNIFVIFHSEQGKKGIARGRLLGAAVSLLVMFILFVAGADKWLITWEAILLTIFSVVVFVMYPGMVKKKVRSNIQKMKLEGRLPYEPTSTLEFRENELFEVTPQGTRTVPYSEFMDAYDTDEYIFLREGAQKAFVLPKHCLGDREAELLAFLTGKMKVVREHSREE